MDYFCPEMSGGGGGSALNFTECGGEGPWRGGGSNAHVPHDLDTKAVDLSAKTRFKAHRVYPSIDNTFYMSW